MENENGKVFTLLEATPFAHFTHKKEIRKVLNEALKDFPFVIFCNGITAGEESHYSFSLKKEIAKKGDDTIQTEDIESIKREVAKWLERQFYGIKRNKGLYLVNPPYPEPSKTGKPSSATTPQQP